MIRSSSRSFAPSNLFNERIYELNDNSGSVMTDHTPTFATNYHQPFRGVDSDAMIHSRTMQSQVCLYLISLINVEDVEVGINVEGGILWKKN